MAYISLRNIHPFWSGYNIEGSSRQACFHTQVTKLIRLIMFDKTSEQRCCIDALYLLQRIWSWLLGTYVRSKIYIAQTKDSRVDSTRSRTFGCIPRAANASMNPGIFFSLSRGRCFPLPKQGSVKPQPVKVWNLRSASNRDGFDSSRIIWEILM